MRKSILLTLLVTITFISCRKKGCTDPYANNYNSTAQVDNGTCLYDSIIPNIASLIINTSHVFENKSFSFDSIYQDNFGNQIQFSRATFYLGKPKYINTSENTIDSTNNYVLIDPTNTSYNLGAVIPGIYQELDLLMGVDLITNHLDPAIYDSDNALSYQSPSMHWQMGSSAQNWSYLFIVLEGLVDKNGNNNFDAGESFVFHIGNDGLTSEINDIIVNLIVQEGENEILEFKVDWSRFFDGIDLSTNNFTHTADNPTLADAISNNGVNVLQVQ